MGARATEVRDEFEQRERERTDYRRRWEDSPTVAVVRNDLSPEQIRADMARTREEMAETIDEIQDRLSAENLKNHAKDVVRDATIGRVEEMSYRANRKVKGVTANIVETIKDNPVPAALVGIGLGWLAMKGPDRPSYNYPYYRDQYGQEHYRPELGHRRERYMSDEMRYGRGGRMDDMRHRAEGTVRDVRDTAEEALDNVRESAREVGEQAREMGRQAKERVEEFTHDARDRVDHLRYEARERAEEWGDEIQYRARDASERARTTYYSNPLAVAAAAVGLGLVIGLAVPETEAEHRWMGETRDELMERAKEATQETVERVQRVAEEAGRAASEEAEEQFSDVVERTGTQNRT
jgi:ElaB/YqjD/DUF883 family membrane-anchored ribosome-binding protein/predicted RNase H-like HicB family nuclease